jgi:MarR family 2-MHQ and catechol resistance regulon transcriptional repressor
MPKQPDGHKSTQNRQRAEPKRYPHRTQKAMSTWISLVRVFQKIRAYELEHITASGLTMNRFEVLEALYHKGELAISQITRLISSTPGNVTVVIRNLERDALITTRTDDSDARVRIACITEAGAELIAGMFDEHSKRLQSCFDALADDELELLLGTLRKLYKTDTKG